MILFTVQTSIVALIFQDGKLKHSDVGKVWREYPPNLHNWLLQLTEEYDLTFKLVNEKANLVPCLLPEKKPQVGSIKFIVNKVIFTGNLFASKKEIKKMNSHEKSSRNGEC